MNNKLITPFTAEQANAKLIELKDRTLLAITAHMKNLIDTNYIDVENAAKLIRWPEHGQRQLLTMIQVSQEGKIFIHNNQGEVDLLSLEFSAVALINILDAIEETIIVK